MGARSLARATTPAELSLLSPLANRGLSVSGLRQDLYHVRDGELTQSRLELEQTATRADRTARDHPGWSWAPFVLARIFGAMNQAGWEPLRPDDGKSQFESYPDAMWRNLRAALEHEPELTAARRWFVSLAVAGGDRLLQPDQGVVLAREVTRANPAPDALLAWGRSLRTYRIYDSALAVFNRAAGLGGDRSRLDLERARTMRALHDTTGASAAYWDGIAHLTPVGRELYRYDLAWLISADSLVAFDKTPDGGVARWLHRFWDERDAAAANRPGERLDEHLRRWAFAYAHFRVRAPWRRTMYTRVDMYIDNDNCQHFDPSLYDLLWKMPPPQHAGDPRYREWLLDHRGIIYLRHGEPLEMLGGMGARYPRENFTAGETPDVGDESATWAPWTMVIQKDRVAAPGGRPLAMFTKGPGLIIAQSVPRYPQSWLYLIDGQLQLLHFRETLAIGMYGPTTLVSYLPFDRSLTAQWSRISATMPEYRLPPQRGSRRKCNSGRKRTIRRDAGMRFAPPMTAVDPTRMSRCTRIPTRRRC